MIATVHIPGCGRRRIRMPLAEFFETPFMLRRAKTAMCEPLELLCDYLPGDPPLDDPEEFSSMVAEACENATNFALESVALDDDDVSYCSRVLVWPPPMPDPPTPALAMAA